MLDYFNSETAHYFETEPYSRILSCIREGKENAVHLSELIQYSGMPERTVRRIIRYLRRQGIVIISSQSGYYFPADETELRVFIKQEERRAKSVFYTLRAARQLLKNNT